VWLYAALASGEARQIRERALLSAGQVAAEVGADPSTVFRWEAGQRPRTATAVRYARVLRRLERESREVSS
jgi:DNA-binding transcriptional regulator YiaG